MRPRRDTLLEGKWFDELRRQAAEMGVPAEPLIRRVHTRLVVAADTGDGTGELERTDAITAAHEDAADLVASILLATHLAYAEQRGGQHRLMRAALYAAMADRELQLARTH